MLVVHFLVSPSYPTFGQLTCFFEDPEDVNFFMKAGLFLVVPFTKMILVSFFVRAIRSNIPLCRNLFGSFVGVFLVEFVGFVDFMFAFVDCREIGDETFTRIQMNTVCDIPQYEMFKNYAVYPTSLFVGVLIPIFLTMYLTRNAMRNDEL